MEETYRLTEKGMVLALQILERDGYLPEPTVNLDVDIVQLEQACARYLENSRAKGEARNSQEASDAIIIAYFEGYLKDLSNRLVN